MYQLGIEQMEQIEGGGWGECVAGSIVSVAGTFALVLGPATGGLSLAVWGAGWALNMYCYYKDLNG